MLARLTAEQFAELCRRWQVKVYRAFQGGTQYGVDWPTLNACYPKLARIGRKLRTEAHRRATVSCT